jgi:hypothetical protein
VWYLRPNAAPTGGRYDLLLYFNGFTGMTDNRFGILRRPEASSNPTDWEVPPGSTLPPSNAPGRKVSDGYARRNNISGFSQFAIGETSVPLPVTLTHFLVQRSNETRVRVSWQTEMEQNNAGFNIERRLDNETSFKPVGFHPSKAPGGNSSGKIDYALTDANGHAGISYYRVKQNDYNGNSFYTMVKAVDGTGKSSVSVLLWPNPVKGQFSIRIDGITDAKEGSIINAAGVVTEKFRINGREDINVSRLPAGTYTVLIPDAFGPGKHFSEKVLVVK